MSKNKNLEDSLSITRLILLCCGIKMETSKKDMFYKLLFIFNFLWLNTDVIGEFYWLFEGVQMKKSFNDLCSIAPCTTICLLSTAKTLPFFFHQETVIYIYDKLKEIHPSTNEISETDKLEVNGIDIEKTAEKDSSKFLKRLSKMYLFLCVLVVTAFSFTAIIFMAYNYIETGSWEVIFPFNIKYFFDPYTKIMWPLVYFHQVWSTVIAFINVFGTDTFFYAFCVYMKMHFFILQHRFQDALECNGKNFDRVVRRHQELIFLVEQVNILYSKSTLFNIVTSSILICLSGFNVTSLQNPSAVFSFVTFLTLSLSQIFLLCYFGDMLMKSSMEISDALYNSNWYRCDNDIKKSVLFVIARARKPCKLTAANFADINLRAFTTILSRSWSYFALLKTVYK